MKKNIIQSATEPDKNSLWLSPQGLKKFSKKGWELIGGSTGEDPSSGGSNDYILPFITEGNIDSKYFDEIKEAINSGKTIKHKNSNGSYRTIDYTIVKDEYIYCFIGNFDENTQIIDITKSGYAFEYNICSISGHTGQTIYINGDTPTQPALQSGYFNSGYTFYDNKLFGYRLNIFDIFTGECKIEDGIYTIRFERESNDTRTTLGRCIIYSDSNNEKRITIVNEQEARDISIPGFVYAKGLAEDLGYDELPTNYGDIFYINLRDYEYGRKYKKNNFGIPYPEERTSILLNNPLVSFKFSYDRCIYKNNTIDQLANELSYNKELYKTIDNILIIDYSDINENLPQNYPDITNKPLYITGLWDYTPDNGSLTKRFIPAIYTYNGAGSFTINYKVDISGPYEKKQIVGLIYYNGADKINHTYHTVCPSYTINLNVQDGTNTGTFDANNINIYREVRQTIYGGGQIVIKGTDTTNYVEAGAVATDHVVLRWSVPRIEEDGTSVTLSVYELKLTPEDYTTKVIHKTI